MRFAALTLFLLASSSSFADPVVLGQVVLGEVKRVQKGEAAPQAGCWFSENKCIEAARNKKALEALDKDPPLPSFIWVVGAFVLGFLSGGVIALKLTK